MKGASEVLWGVELQDREAEASEEAAPAEVAKEEEGWAEEATEAVKQGAEVSEGAVAEEEAE